MDSHVYNCWKINFSIIRGKISSFCLVSDSAVNHNCFVCSRQYLGNTHRHSIQRLLSKLNMNAAAFLLWGEKMLTHWPQNWVIWRIKSLKPIQPVLCFCLEYSPTSNTDLPGRYLNHLVGELRLLQISYIETSQSTLGGWLCKIDLFLALILSCQCDCQIDCETLHSSQNNS